MNKPHYLFFIVYQNNLANVFRVHQRSPYERVRLCQGGFKECESFLLGCHAMGATTRRAWCNKEGDINKYPWSVQCFENAPFHEKMSKEIELICTI